MILPASFGGFQISIPIEVSDPGAVVSPTRDTYQLGSQVIDLNPISAFAIDEFVQTMAFLFEDSAIETHNLPVAQMREETNEGVTGVAGVQELQNGSAQFGHSVTPVLL
jgi:hypothetical protein